MKLSGWLSHFDKLPALALVCTLSPVDATFANASVFIDPTRSDVWLRDNLQQAPGEIGSPADLRVSNQDFRVGRTNRGSLSVTGGGQVVTNGGVLGSDLTSEGVVTIDGADSSWISNGIVTVGSSGTGQIEVTSGGKLDINRTLYLGRRVDGVGAITLSGSGSILDVTRGIQTRSINVGYAGDGFLTVSDGALAQTYYVGIGSGSDDGGGSVTISGADSRLLALTGLGTVRLNDTAGGARLDVNDGGTVESENGYINGPLSEASVVGDGSLWDIRSAFSVGADAPPVLISQGARVSIGGRASVGNEGTGSINVTGESTSLFAHELLLGTNPGSHGSIRVSDAASVVTNHASSAWSQNSVGRILISGVGTQWQTVNTLEVGGTLNDGAFDVIDGATATTGTTRINYGVATITDAGSRWLNTGHTSVGFGSAGSLVVSDGAIFGTESMMISDDGSHASVNGEGSVIEVFADLDVADGSRWGRLELARGGLAWIKGDVRGGPLDFVVGDRGDGVHVPGTMWVGARDDGDTSLLDLSSGYDELTIAVDDVSELALGQTLRLIDYEAITGEFTVWIDGRRRFLADDSLYFSDSGVAFRIDYDADLDGRGDLGVTATVETIASGLPGDFNADGTVDSADYVVWRDHLGAPDESGIQLGGDGRNGVDQADRDLWAANFGRSLATSDGTITPEPASVMSVLFIACTMAGVRRSSRG